MTDNIRISIPKPCHEDWNKMTPADKGRFCANCQKKVYDFTFATDREILEKFNSGENLCGRFLPSQLGRELSVPRNKPSWWIAAAIGLLTFLHPGNTLYAQDEPNIVQTENHENQSSGNSSQPLTEHLITGIVSDSAGTIPGVNVVVKGTTRSVQTDIDGNYSIMATPGEVLVFSFVGMNDQEIIVGSSHKINVTMDSHGITLLGGPMLAQKRSWAGRAITWIGNRFRSKDERISCKYK